MSGLDPSEQFANTPDPELRGRAGKGRARMVVEIKQSVLEAALKRAKRRGITLAALVEDALLRRGAAAIIAALLVGLAFVGCNRATAEKSCDFPAEMPCRLGSAPPSSEWQKGRWGEIKWTAKPDAPPVRRSPARPSGQVSPRNLATIEAQAALE